MERSRRGNTRGGVNANCGRKWYPCFPDGAQPLNKSEAERADRVKSGKCRRTSISMTTISNPAFQEGHMVDVALSPAGQKQTRIYCQARKRLVMPVRQPTCIIRPVKTVCPWRVTNIPTVTHKRRDVKQKEKIVQRTQGASSREAGVSLSSGVKVKELAQRYFCFSLGQSLMSI